MKLILAFALAFCLAGGVISQEEFVTCDYRQEKPECARRLPFCQTYAYAATDFPQQYKFRCLICDEGFSALNSEGVVARMDEDHNLPDLENKEDYLELCERTQSEKILWSSNHVSHKELPHCRRYRIHNIQSTPIGSGKFERRGDFECFECKDQFSLSPNQNVTASLDFDEKKRLCQRNLGKIECGPKCQKEFPGCLQVTISKRSFSDDGEHEYAEFFCNQPMPGYNAINRIIKGNTDPTFIKDLVLPEYQSPLIDCNDNFCDHVIPNCDQYYTMSTSTGKTHYVCTKCRDGFKALELGAYDDDIFELYYQKRRVHVCALTAFENKKLDDDWKREVPGCERLTVKDVTDASSPNQLATYTCTQCEDGFEAVENEEVEYVAGKDWNLADRIKHRCRPIILSGDINCDAACRKTFPYCQGYRVSYIEKLFPHMQKFECLQCDDGFEPTSTPAFDAWYSNKQKKVCRPVETTESECDELCQEIFPYCQNVSVIAAPKTGKNTYVCHACALGHHRISYEDGFLGQISAPENPMRQYNAIHLCTDVVGEVYTAITDCSDTELEVFDQDACHKTVNCKIVARVKHVPTGEQYYKCLECPVGQRVKAFLPGPYELDQRYCEKDDSPQLE